jgi:cullin 1
MIKKKPKAKPDKNPKGKKDKADSQTISLKDGWDRIYKVGVDPFFERVENVDDPDQMKKTSIPQQQYILAYDTIFTMCIQREPYNYSAPLYQKHSEALTRYFKEKAVPALQKAKEQHGLIFLKEWVKRWRCNKWAVDGMTRMFMYLDRFHVPNSEDLLSTSEQGYTLFRQNVFEQFKDMARNAILDCILRERDGEEQDRDLLRDSILVFVELGNKLKKVELQIYKEDFHKALVAQTKQYYKQKSRFWLDQQSCPEYLVTAEKCVQDEEGRLASYIDKYSSDGLMTATREELLKHHQDELLDKSTGINSMLERTVGADAESAREDLARLFRLYQSVQGGLAKIAESVKQHICALGHAFIAKSKEAKEGEKDHELIRALIDLHDRFLKIVKTQFQSEQVFHKALKEAFEEFINKEYYTSQLLARFANDILKKGTKIAVAGDLENTMGHVVMLYGYIRDKDMFERDYQQYLASRLLQDLSQSEQSERSMIGKLKTESGYHWTSKLEEMFKDIQRSKELMQDFRKKFSDSELELNVSVCTTGAWPTSSIQPVKKPEEIAPIADKYTQFYLNRFSGRRLNFQMDKGKADVNVMFNPKCKKILVVSTYQMVVLLLFNKKNTWTFKEMTDNTGIPKEDLMVAVLSMAHPKVKVMRKSPNSKEIADDHKFQINPKYQNARAKIHIPTLNIKQNDKKQQDENMEAIMRLRRHQMEAAIVRIMKARKTLKHPDLVAEVVKQLAARFTPKPADIKKRIASLIELEYLERDENDRQTYHYKM